MWVGKISPPVCPPHHPPQPEARLEHPVNMPGGRERSLQSSKEWEDIVVVSTPLCVNLISKFYGSFFFFFVIFGVFLPDFSSTSLEEFFLDSFREVEC
jgi:hypothetical protein